MNLTVERFMEQLENVIRWNAVKGPEDFSQDSINKQAEYAREEIRETMAALLASDHKEVLDGVADVFVTYGYKLYQMFNEQNIYAKANGNQEIDFEEVVKKAFVIVQQSGLEAINDRHLAEMDCLYSASSVCQFNDLNKNFNTSCVSVLVELLTLAELDFCEDIMDVVQHVMDSNWSKYPKIGSVDIYKECFQIEMNNAGRYSNVTPAINQEYGVVVFRSDNGAGKIMKPSTFFEPDCAQFLS